MLRKREIMVPQKGIAVRNLLRQQRLLSLKSKEVRLKIQGNTRPESVKSWWLFIPLVRDNISKFLPALEW